MAEGRRSVVGKGVRMQENARRGSLSHLISKQRAAGQGAEAEELDRDDGQFAFHARQLLLTWARRETAASEVPRAPPLRPRTTLLTTTALHPSALAHLLHSPPSSCCPSATRIQIRRGSRLSSRRNTRRQQLSQKTRLSARPVASHTNGTMPGSPPHLPVLPAGFGTDSSYPPIPAARASPPLSPGRRSCRHQHRCRVHRHSPAPPTAPQAHHCRRCHPARSSRNGVDTSPPATHLRPSRLLRASGQASSSTHPHHHRPHPRATLSEASQPHLHNTCSHPQPHPHPPCQHRVACSRHRPLHPHPHHHTHTRSSFPTACTTCR